MDFTFVRSGPALLSRVPFALAGLSCFLKQNVNYHFFAKTIAHYCLHNSDISRLLYL